MQTTLNRRISVIFVARSAGRGVLRAVSDALAAAFGLLLTWQGRSRQRADLTGMSDRMLADIGVSRLDAMNEASKPFWVD